MSFDQIERSIEHAVPVTIYRFVYGDRASDVFLYTDGEEDVLWNGERYERHPITHDDINFTGNLSKSDFKITVAASAGIAGLFRDYPPSFVIAVEVLEGHANDDMRQFQIVFRGRILNCNREGAAATLTGQPASTSLKRPGLRRNYQRQCPLPLYGPDCRAARVALPLVVLEAGDNTITAEMPVDGLPVVKEAYAGGTVEWRDGTGRKNIRSVMEVTTTGDVVTIRCFGTASFDRVATELQLIKGCPRTEAACKDWHNNQLNYGGQLWIPASNPINTTSTYL